MPLLNCPKEELLLQYLSIPHDISLRQRFQIRLHLKSCSPCLEKSFAIREKLQAYFSPRTDITSSLLKVYSRLQNDETLILKGWKLSEIGSKHARRQSVARNWLFRGSIAMGLGSLLILFLIADDGGSETPLKQARFEQNKVPFAQIRFQDKNRVQIQYLKPELVQSVEFETTGRGR